MKRRDVLALLATGALACDRPRKAQTDATTTRAVVAGGALTEIVFALGAEQFVVGVDTSSTFPAATGALPKVGYQRQLSAEGVLSLRPTLLVLSPEAGPANIVEQIRGSGVRVVSIALPTEPRHVVDRITEVGAVFDLSARAAEIARDVEADLARAETNAAARARRPSTLFVYARGPNVMMAGGANTPAALMLSLAGLKNAAGKLDGYKPLTPESAAALDPEIIVVPEKGLESVGGAAGVFSTPGLAGTRAAKAKRLVAIEDLLLLGLGPRIGQAVDALAEKAFSGA